MIQGIIQGINEKVMTTSQSSNCNFPENMNVLLSLFRKFHNGGQRGPQIDTTYKGNFDGLHRSYP